jgi:two-component system, NtrC family, nitrogen regulation sensor histidine kinase NtrY
MPERLNYYINTMSLSTHSSDAQPPEKVTPRLNRRRLWKIVVLGLGTALLFTLLFVQAAFNTLIWLRPSNLSETLSLYVLSTINVLAFVVLLMLLVRNIMKLRRERLQKKLGSRFKTRLVMFFILLSLLPVIFLFIATWGLINRSIEKWFSLPGEEMLRTAQLIQSTYLNGEKDGLNQIAETLARLVAQKQGGQLGMFLSAEIETHRLMFARLYNADGNLVWQKANVDLNKVDPNFGAAVEQAYLNVSQGIWYDSDLSDERTTLYLISAVPLPAERGGALIIAQQLSQEIAASVNKFRKLELGYNSLREEDKSIRYSFLLTLATITLFLLFIALWLALHIARSIAEPVQQLAEATERVKRGDLSYRAGVSGDDELAALALSFNEMTAEIGENRRQLEQSATELQLSNSELDERRRYIETILQSLSAGVISLDAKMRVTTINEAALKLLWLEQAPVTGSSLGSILPDEQVEELRRMILRATRLRSITHEVHFRLPKQRKLDAAVTVTSLENPQGQAHGVVIVIEDLTELIEAQRRAAWSEIARRMAHEIKNPLTPIRLSAERLAKNLLGEGNGKGGSEAMTERQTEIVRECTAMIGAEVTTLQRMVDEFSKFARLPKAKPAMASLNEVVENTIKLYDERLDGIRLESDLASGLASVMIDPEQIKRLLVNLIDNAAESLANGDHDDDQSIRVINVSTREFAERQWVELTVADNGPGIPPEDRERIFDPYFSRRKGGTGLGLAIVRRIVAEHQGYIRVQENMPHGARFVIELPAMKPEEVKQHLP